MYGAGNGPHLDRCQLVVESGDGNGGRSTRTCRLAAFQASNSEAVWPSVASATPATYCYISTSSVPIEWRRRIQGRMSSRRTEKEYSPGAYSYRSFSSSSER